MRSNWANFFAPATRLINHLKYPQKFALLSFVFLLPLGLALFLLLSEIQNQIRFAQKELQGVQYLKSLQQFTLALLQYSPKTDNHLLKAWSILQQTEANADLDLQTSLPFQHLTQEWQAWQKTKGIATKTAPWNSLQNPVQQLRQQVGDRSNLILDPDLDSYYLMDGILLTLPDIQNNLAAIQSLLQTIPKEGTLTSWQQAQLLTRRDNLLQLNQSLANNLKIALSNNPSGILAPQLTQPRQTQERSLMTLTKDLERILTETRSPNFSKLARQTAQSTTQSLEDTAQLWDRLAPSLMELLNLRIQGFQQRQGFLGSFVLLTLAIAVYLFIGFYLSVMATVHRLSAASERMVAGDQSQPLTLDTRDEMAEVIQAFNTVADALRSAEAKFRGIVENAVVGIYQTSLSGQYLMVNPRLAQIYGYESPQAMITALTDIREQLYVNPQRREEFIQILTEQGQTTDFESEVYRQDHCTIWISESARAIRNAQGEIIGFEGTVVDISQRKQDELEIAHLTQQLQDDNLRMGAELAVTRRLQQMLMPSDQELSSVAGLDISGFMEPADEVGGDYYDIQQANGKTRISIGDVTGHGLESNLVMIMAQTAVRTLLANGETNPARLLNAVNQTIYDNTRRMGSYKNMTLVLLEYEAGLLRLSGQHEEILVVRADGSIEQIDTFDLGFPLGLESDISQFVGETTLQLHPGDIAALYTDGITEAMNPDKQQYGLERMHNVLRENRDRTAAEIRQAIISDLRQWIHTQKVFDDITLLILKQK